MKRCIRAYLKTHEPHTPIQLTFLNTLGYINKEPAIITYAVRRKIRPNKARTEVLGVEEVYRFTLKRKQVKNIYLTSYCGYRAFFKEKYLNGQGSYFSPDLYETTWSNTDRVIHCPVENLYTKEEVQQHFIKVIPYLVIPQEIQGNEIINYLEMYDPTAEMLTKNGLGYLWNSKLIRRLGKKDKKLIYKWILKHIEDLKRVKLNASSIISGARAGISVNEVLFNKSKRLAEIVIEDNKYNFPQDKLNDLIKYIIKVNGIVDTTISSYDIRYYFDYWVAAQSLGESIMYPKDLVTEHNRVMELQRVSKNAKIDKGIELVYNKFKGLKSRSNKHRLSIKVAGSREELYTWGEELHICIGKHDSYALRMSQGNVLLLAVMDENRPLECAEISISGKAKLLQLRGKYNSYSEKHKECEVLVDKFIKQLKEVQVAENN